MLKDVLGAWGKRRAPLQSVEGFVRQIIGWREFIRGVYFHEGPPYESRNTLDHHGALPEFYWTAKTDMNCMRHCIDQVLEHAYGHHIQRLMITGNFALIAGVHPKRVSDWYLGMYADAVDWVTLPNTLGMSQHADGGVVGTKPYAAGANYIGKMSNYCKGCRYDPKKRTGENACPFNTLYWDFMIRHRQRFAKNQRMSMMVKNVERMSKTEITEITKDGKRLKQKFGVE
jgi:deoxyribodipyrimidine photolyase-related protein